MTHSEYVKEASAEMRTLFEEFASFIAPIAEAFPEIHKKLLDDKLNELHTDYINVGRMLLNPC